MQINLLTTSFLKLALPAICLVALLIVSTHAQWTLSPPVTPAGTGTPTPSTIMDGQAPIYGPQHRFTTGFWTDGVFDKTPGQIQGNLYVTGRDPSFHYEHAIMVAHQLNNMGVRSVTGNLVLSPGFTMNFNSSPSRSGEWLYDTLDSTLRSGEATRSWLYERTTLGDKASLQTVPTVAVMGDISVGTVPPSARLLLSHKSSQLTNILKVLLCYSNNFMAERLGDSLGGKDSVTAELVKLGIPPEEIQLASLS